MQKFERAHFEVKEYDESKHYGKFVFEPSGFSTSLYIFQESLMMFRP